MPGSGLLSFCAVVSGTYIDFEEERFPTGGLMCVQKRQGFLLLLNWSHEGRLMKEHTVQRHTCCAAAGSRTSSLPVGNSENKCLNLIKGGFGVKGNLATPALRCETVTQNQMSILLLVRL